MKNTSIDQNLMDQMLEAVLQGNTPRVEELVQSYGNTSQRNLIKDIEENSAVKLLHIAVTAGHIATIQYLVNNGANIDSQSNEGDTPLHRAVLGENLHVVQYLVGNGANIDLSDNNVCTPLYYAAKWGKYDIVKYLVENGAGIMISSVDGVTPATIAAAKGYIEIASYLLSPKDLDTAIYDLAKQWAATILEGETQPDEGTNPTGNIIDPEDDN